MNAVSNQSQPEPAVHVEDVELAGHIIDSLILPKVLDLITAMGGAFRMTQIAIGQGRSDSSHASIEVQAPTRELLDEILEQICDHGAVLTRAQDCHTVAADLAGAFPEGFYSTTNQRTEVRIAGRWIEVDRQEMDCGIAVELDPPSAWCVPMSDVARGTKFVVGHGGVRVFPAERSDGPRLFEFMGSSVSTEKPKGIAIREIAGELHRTRSEGGKVLIVGGPAIVHTGSGGHLTQMIRSGYVDVLFAGNALATHDIEQALFGTSLGVHLQHGSVTDGGHEHHLRSINRIRRAGGIAAAIEEGLLTTGIMHACHKSGVDYLLAGSIRDDGPLPEVVTDVVEAQRRMREMIDGVTFCLMIATTLHSIAVGNILPAWVKVVCVDINPSTVVKLSDRGTMQTVGMVTDVEPFLRALVQELDELRSERPAERTKV